MGVIVTIFGIFEYEKFERAKSEGWFVLHKIKHWNQTLESY